MAEVGLTGEWSTPAVSNVWGDGATWQEDTEADEARQSLRMRFQKLSAKVKGGLRRRIFHLRSRSAHEGYDDFGYEETAWDNDLGYEETAWDNDLGDEETAWDNDLGDEETAWDSWGDSSEPLISSLFDKFASSLKGFVRKYSPRRQRTNSYQGSTLAGDSWQTQQVSWDLERIDVEVNREETEQAIPQVAKQVANFTGPLAESSDVEAEDFLSRFLSTRREVDIHGDRKHKLAMFLARVCEEASFAFVSRHRPEMLTLLQISTPDQVEFEVWITLVGYIRDCSRTLNDRCRWPDPDIWSAFPTPQETDNITRLRHVAVHRWDYNSKLIEDVVWYLEKLSDQTRLRQVGKALRELYYVEDEDSSNSPSSASTLLGFQDEVGCTPGIEMPIGATTYQQLLRSCQHILERSLFNFARQKFPSGLLSRGRTCASQIELNEYSSCFHGQMCEALPDIPQAQVSDLLYAARMFRNASAHHHEFSVDVDYVNRDHFRDAEAVALMVGDEEAAAKIRLLVHVADINCRTAVQKAKMEEAQRSLVDWEGLERASEGQQLNWRYPGRQGWVRSRLGTSQWYFSSKTREAREKSGEFGEILRRWERHLYI
ncbi:MAG: hypothetical protein Q9178_005711 [Gyalolechia marmorata]